jgi:hypothetical protein
VTVPHDINRDGASWVTEVNDVPSQPQVTNWNLESISTRGALAAFTVPSAPKARLRVRVLVGRYTAP